MLFSSSLDLVFPDKSVIDTFILASVLKRLFGKEKLSNLSLNISTQPRHIWNAVPHDKSVTMRKGDLDFTVASNRGKL